MAYTLEILCAVAVIYLVSVSLRVWSNHNRLRRVARQFGCQPAKQYPNWEPFLGLDLFASLHRADTRGQRSQAYADLHKRYGKTFEMKALSASVIHTADPQNIQAVSATKFNDFGVGPIRKSVGVPFLDGGVFTEDGEFWRHSRSLIRPTFNRVEIADLHSFERHVGRFLALLPKDSTTFDIQPLIKRLVSMRCGCLGRGHSADSSLLVSGYLERVSLRSVDRIAITTDAIRYSRFYEGF